MSKLLPKLIKTSNNPVKKITAWPLHWLEDQDHLERLLFQKVRFFFSFHQALLVLRFLHLIIINQSLSIIIVENPATCSLVILLFLKNLQIQNPTPPRTRAATFLILDLLQIRFLFLLTNRKRPMTTEVGKPVLPDSSGSISITNHQY